MYISHKSNDNKILLKLIYRESNYCNIFNIIGFVISCISILHLHIQYIALDFVFIPTNENLFMRINNDHIKHQNEENVTSGTLD